MVLRGLHDTLLGFLSALKCTVPREGWLVRLSKLKELKLREAQGHTASKGLS